MWKMMLYLTRNNLKKGNPLQNVNYWDGQHETFVYNSRHTFVSDYTQSLMMCIWYRSSETIVLYNMSI